MQNRIDGEAAAELSAQARESIWLRAIAAGGRAADKAMEALYEAYQRKLRSALWKRRFPDADAEDLTQRVWEAVLRKREKFPDGMAPGILVWRQFRDIVSLVAREHGRSLPTLGDEAAGHAEDVEPAPAWPGTAPLTEAALGEARDRCVQDKLERFKQERPADHRLLEMVYYEGWELPELAEHLGIKPGTLRQRLLEARRRIKELVRPCNELDAE